jgi:predicted ATPase/DNA-binding XRE family transcriptional regulator
MAPPDTIGAWMKHCRKELDLTQKDLADRVGCSTATIHKIEREERRPSRQIATLIAKALEMSPDQQAEFVKLARGERRSGSLPDQTPPRVQPTTSRVPVPLTPIIGREQEIADLERMLCDEDCRLVNLVGEGGIGKSRLALEVSRRFEGRHDSCDQHHFPDGIFFVPLVSLDSPDLIIATIADRIGFSFFNPSDPQRQLTNYLQDKHMLLVLDNFEHLTEGAANLAELLTAVPGIKILFTSRARLNLQGEWVFALDSLPYPPADSNSTSWEDYSAIAMFTQCARRKVAGFSINKDNGQAVQQICQMVNGMPLALELAASWINTLDPEEIVEEIRKDIDFLATSARDIPDRHRSIRAVFEHSWELLSTPERGAFQRLSVFRGSFTRQAANTITNAGLDTLVSLVEKSLLYRTQDGYFEIHELLRHYAAGQLALDEKEFDDIHSRHSAYFLNLLAQREADLRGRRKPAVLQELTSQIDDMRLAWTWAVSHARLYDLVKSAGGLLYYYDSRNLLPEGQKMFNQALEMINLLRDGPATGAFQETQSADVLTDIALAQMLSDTAYFNIRLSRIREGIAKLQRSIPLLVRHHEDALLADAYWYLASGHTSEGNYQEATRGLRESIVLNRRLGRRWQEAMAGLTLGQVMTRLGSHLEAHRQLVEVLRMGRELEDTRIIVLAISSLCQVKLLIGYPDEALELLEEGCQMAEEAGDYYGMTLTLSHMALASQTLKDYPAAQELYQDSIDLYRKIGDHWGLSGALVQYGEFCLEIDKPDRAQVSFIEALEKSNRAGASPITLDALAGIAKVKAESGDIEYASQLLKLVLAHPATSQPTRERASLLISELDSQLPEEFAPSDLPLPMTLESVVAELLVR